MSESIFSGSICWVHVGCLSGRFLIPKKQRWGGAPGLVIRSEAVSGFPLTNGRGNKLRACDFGCGFSPCV